MKTKCIEVIEFPVALQLRAQGILINHLIKEPWQDVIYIFTAALPRMKHSRVIALPLLDTRRVLKILDRVGKGKL